MPFAAGLFRVQPHPMDDPAFRYGQAEEEIRFLFFTTGYVDLPAF